LKIVGMSQFHSHIVTAPKSARKAGTITTAAVIRPTFALTDRSDHRL
jgi:hypothetical protein